MPREKNKNPVNLFYFFYLFTFFLAGQKVYWNYSEQRYFIAVCYVGVRARDKKLRMQVLLYAERLEMRRVCMSGETQRLGFRA